MTIWLVVSTHLQNISEIGSFPQVGVKIKNPWNHHLDGYWYRIRLMVAVELRSFQWRHVNWSFRLQARGVSLFQCVCVLYCFFFVWEKRCFNRLCEDTKNSTQVSFSTQNQNEMILSSGSSSVLPFLKNLETKKKIHKIHNETPEPKKRPSGPCCLHRHNLRYKAWKNRRNLHGMKWYLHYLKFGQFHLCIYINIYIYTIYNIYIYLYHI